jgi:eukaryotic-like serine/threonine-protein kinase
MTCTPGTRFGPYEVTSILGTGGMGEVYRARDGRLERDVALKVLPSALTVDGERLLRFKREALVLASLNHPNIAAIYGLEEGRPSGSELPAEALVLELVEGPTLAERIAQGPLPLDEARAIGMQIAGALEAAHERGIVHRDLKPANVKVRPDGTVKVLDFGLAKAWEPPSSEQIDALASPTFTSPAMTGTGIILGTAAYMSPEQARGAPVDKRTDVWAFGCVLFEMLAGRHVFGGAGTISDAIAAVLKSEPDWQAVPENTPPHIRSLLKRCLEKDPRRRLRDIGDAGLLLGDDPDSSDATSPKLRATVPSAGAARWTRWAAVAGWTVAVVLAIVNALWIAGGFRSEPPSPATPLRLALPLAPQLVPESAARPFAISSDGTRIVYVGRDSTGSSLYLQDLASGELKRLSETADAEAPAFSPDGRAVAFRSGSAIKLLPLDGGLPRDIARVDTRLEHFAWSGPDHIIVAGVTGLSRVPVSGGSPELLAKLAPGEAVFASAFALPDGAYLVSVHATTTTDDASRVAVVIPGNSERLAIAERGGSPTFVASDGPGFGHILYADAGRLMALPFDAERRVVKGAAVPIVENIAMRPNGDYANYAVSPTGTLVFREGSLHELVSIDRGSGAVRPLSANLRRFALPRLSPDGKRLAVEIQDSPHQIWMLDIERDVLVPLTTESTGSHDFAWAPDGSSIVYTLGAATPPQLGWIRTNGSPSAEKIGVAADARVSVRDWSREGKLALLVGVPPKHAVMTLRLDAGAPPRAAGAPVKIAEGVPGSFSPDGAWLALCDCWNVRERPANVFIRHLQSGTEHQVSLNGGTEPVWAEAGRELFFRAGQKMMVVGLAIDGTSVRIGRPLKVFEVDYLLWGTGNYDVSRDSKQFVMVRAATANTRTLSNRLHWTTQLQRLAPIQP